MTLEVGCAYRAHFSEEEFLYEYERWNIVHGWSSEHLLPTDPGRWSDRGMKRWADDFDDIASALPKGYEVEREFEITGRPGSGMGWEYSIGFRMPSWFDEQNALARVRRRLWKRVIVNKKALEEHKL